MIAAPPQWLPVAPGRRRAAACRPAVFDDQQLRTDDLFQGPRLVYVFGHRGGCLQGWAAVGRAAGGPTST